MANKTRTHLVPSDSFAPQSGLKPAHLTREEFAERLYSLMTRRGWHQADLVRAAHVSRDAVSKYCGAKNLPTPINLNKIASALGVKPEDLMGNHVESAILNDTASIDIKVSSADPRLAWLRINRLVKTETAFKVGEILAADDASVGQAANDAANRG